MFRSVARFLELFGLKRAPFLKKLEGEVRPTGQLTAVRRSSRQAKPLQARVDDAMSESDSVVVARASGSDIDAVRLAGDVRSAAADLSEGGSLSLSIQGQSPHGEEDTQHVCEILIERLNHGGSRWILSGPSKVRPREEGIDCKACDGQETLRIQVTRIGTKEFWKTLGDQGRVESLSTADASADAIRAAIGHKAIIAGHDLLLALNAINTPQYAFFPVVESFRRRHGSWAAGVGFQEIWVVGPVPSQVARLDK